MELNEKTIQNYVNQYVDKNLSVVQNWQNLGEEQVGHIKNVAASIVRAREGSKSEGHFANDVVSNDLERAIFRADGICLRALKLFVLVKLWVKI